MTAKEAIIIHTSNEMVLLLDKDDLRERVMGSEQATWATDFGKSMHTREWIVARSITKQENDACWKAKELK